MGKKTFKIAIGRLVSITLLLTENFIFLLGKEHLVETLK